MRRPALVVLACLFAILGTALAAPAPPEALAPAGILVDAATGEVLWEREADTPRPIASTTKMMTALLALERGGLDEVVTVSPAAARVPEASLHLKAGERLTMRDLLYGVMLRSANDACVAVAEHVCGDVPAFVERMNARAAELGCTHTHFRNPNGLHETGHASTPRDLAVIARAAMAHPEFRSIARAPVYTVDRSINRYDRRLKSRYHGFLKSYDGADGVKTGYTRQAGHCFVGSATRGPFSLIAVVLHSPSVRRDTAALLDWGFRHYRGGVAVRAGGEVGSIPVSGGAVKTVAVQAAMDAPVTLRRDAPPARPNLSRLEVAAPVTAGQSLGAVPIVSGGETVGRVEIMAASSVGLSPLRLAARGLAGATFLLVGVTVGAFAKDTRRRRSLFPSRRGRPDPRRARAGERRGGAHREPREPGRG